MKKNKASLSSQKEKTRRELVGRQEVDMAKRLFNVGVAQCNKENYEASLSLHQDALEMRRECLEKHEDTAKSLFSVGVVHAKMENYKASLSSHQEALEMRRELLGKHVDTAESLLAVGEVQYLMQNYEASLLSVEESLVMRRELLGKHVDTAMAFFLVGAVHYQMKNFGVSLSSHHEALQMRRELLGKRLDTVDSLLVTSLVQGKMENYEAALFSFQEASEMARELLDKHVDTADRHDITGLAELLRNHDNVQFSTEDLDTRLKPLLQALEIRFQQLCDQLMKQFACHFVITDLEKLAVFSKFKEMRISAHETKNQFDEQQRNVADSTSGPSSVSCVRNNSVGSLPQEVWKELGIKLNPLRDFGGDFRELAGRLEYDMEKIWNLEQKNNPTEELLKHGSPSNSSPSIDFLCKKLEEIRRADVKKVIDEWVKNQNCSCGICDNPRSKTIESAKTPTTTICTTM